MPSPSIISGIVKDVNANKSNLVPILPSIIRDSRYLVGAMLVRDSPTIVPLRAGLVSLPSYKFQGWTISTHLEGRRYAHTTTRAGITIVTEARIVEPGVSDQLDAWLTIICNAITEKRAHLPEASHLFLDINQDICNYYFVDHALRTVFWLHTLDMFGISPPSSFGHLQHSLQENYWIHVELFPETASKYSVAALNGIYDIFMHAGADNITSVSPAFLHTVEEREGFIETLGRGKAHASSPLITTYVARLWGIVATHRSFIRFDSERSPVLTIVSRVLLFGLPDEHRARFESLCVDQLIYTSRWRKHVSEIVNDSKQEMLWILALLSADILMMQISSFPALTKFSLILCVIGLATTLVLLQVQRRLVGAKTTTSAVYPGGWVTGYGFQPIAIVHSLPQAMFVWALVLFAIQHFWMTFACIPVPFFLSTFLTVAVVLIVSYVGIRTALHPRPPSSATLRYRYLHHR